VVQLSLELQVVELGFKDKVKFPLEPYDRQLLSASEAHRTTQENWSRRTRPGPAPRGRAEIPNSSPAVDGTATSHEPVVRRWKGTYEVGCDPGRSEQFQYWAKKSDEPQPIKPCMVLVPYMEGDERLCHHTVLSQDPGAALCPGSSGNDHRRADSEPHCFPASWAEEVSGKRRKRRPSRYDDV